MRVVSNSVYARRMLCVAGIFLLMCCVGNGVAFAEEDFFEALQISRIEPRVQAPDFSLPRIGGGGQVQLSQYKGKVVLLNFWATWCPYCRTERAGLQATHEKYKEKGVVVLSVSIDRTGPETVEQFLVKHQITFPNAHDQTTEVAADYGVRGVPTTYVLDMTGQAVGVMIGPREWDDAAVDGLLEHLLAEAR